MQPETQRLRDLCSLIVDCPHSTPVWTESGYVVIRNQNIKGGRLDLSSPSYTDAEHFAHRIRRAKPTAGDIVFTREAPMGEVCMVPPKLECCVGQRQVLLRPNPKVVDGRFLLYAPQSPQVQHEISWSEGTGSTVSNVRIPVLEALRIPTPDLTTQQEIGVLLGMLDDRIDLLHQTNATLESIAQALFKSWFIDFDPVRAKAEGREPEGMDAATAALFPAEFEESALGLIPKGWRAGDLATLCGNGGGFIQTGPFGSQLHASDYQAQGVPVVMPQDLEGRRISTDRVARVGDVHVERLARHQLMIGDVVFSRRGDVGRHAAVTAEEVGWLCGTGCLLVRPGGLFPSPAYVSQALATSGATEWLKRHAVGATMPNLNTGILGALPLLLPQYQVLAAFEAVAGVLEARISANRAQTAKLVALRDALLPRLISGKLRLPEAQSMMEFAA